MKTDEERPEYVDDTWNKILNYQIYYGLPVSDEIRELHRESLAREANYKMAQEIFDIVNNTGTFSVRISKTDFPHRQTLRVTAHIGKVQEYHLKFKPLAPIGFWQRLRILFTGTIPGRLEEE